MRNEWDYLLEVKNAAVVVVCIFLMVCEGDLRIQIIFTQE